MQILITNPETDAFTRYLLCWSRKLLSEIDNKHQVYHLAKNRVTRKKFEGILSKKPIDLVLLNGHGSSTSVLGGDGVILDAENSVLLKGKTVHTMSCNSAKTLGRIAVEQGAKAFVGYDEPFFAPYMDGKISNPLDDETAALFLNPAFVAQKALVNEKTPDESVTLARKEYNRSIVKALTSPIQSDDDQFVSLLIWDRDHLVAHTQ